MTPDERRLIEKARSGEPITVDDKLAVIATTAEVEWFKAGLQMHGIDTQEALAACARRSAEIQRGSRA